MLSVVGLFGFVSGCNRVLGYVLSGSVRSI